MPTFQFYTYAGKAPLQLQQKIVLDEDSGFDADFCARYEAGYSLELIDPIAGRAAGDEIYVFNAVVEFQSMGFMLAAVESCQRLRDVWDTLEATKPWYPLTCIHQAKKYWDWLYFNQHPLPAFTEDGFFCNLPARSLFREAKSKGEIRLDAWLNAANRLWLRWLPDTQSYRVLHVAAIPEWYHIQHDIFDLEAFLAEYQACLDSAGSPQETDFWHRLLD